jgi:hypothetical protein
MSQKDDNVGMAHNLNPLSYLSLSLPPSLSPSLSLSLFQVRGFIGATGMSWDVSLRDVNAGMPHTVQDMYALGEQSLYLIKVN